jgi:uncharacterized protein YegP (UPF0339 family)
MCGKRTAGERESYFVGRDLFVPISNLKFVIFRDMKDGGGYRWRLSSASGETVERSDRGHPNKGECEREVSRLKADQYPNAKVLDAAIG